ncbi:hypothetical protein JCM8097_005934 [Rhodosporidiobolus ruineniae]
MSNAIATPDEPPSSSSFDVDNSPADERPASRWSWYYSPAVQTIVIGAGMENALSGLGAGGLASAKFWSAANAVSFTLLCVTCVFAPIVINQFNLRWSLVIASCTPTLYAASLYTNSKNGNEWLLMLASVIDGIGSGVYYCTEGSIVVGYPEESRRGRMIATWVFFRQLGSVIGGSILLSLSKDKDSTGAVGLNVYIVFIVLCACAPFVALLLASPEKVRRNDGTKVVIRKTNPKSEIKSLFRQLRSRKVLLLFPLFFTSWFADSFVSSYVTNYLTVRSRALSSLLTPVGGNIGASLVGFFLDSRIANRRTKALVTFGVLFALNLAMWAYSAANIAHYNSFEEAPAFDWTSDGFGRAYLVPFFWTLCELAVQSWAYFLLGTITEDMTELTHLTGILRGIEAAGQAVAYGLSSSSASQFVTIGLGFGLVAISYPLAYFVVRAIKEKKAPVPTVAAADDSDSVSKKDFTA